MNNIKLQIIAITASIAIVAGILTFATSSLKVPSAIPSAALVITKEEAVSLANKKLAAEQIEAELKANGVQWDGKIEIGTPKTL